MITLKTGVPGSGKSHSMVSDLLALHRLWCKKPDQRRMLYVHNVKDFALPHHPLPLVALRDKFGAVLDGKGEPRMVPDWEKVENGSLVVLDECQDLFPPRPAGDKVPPHVAALNTHRHRGQDIIVITQHPKLIDTALRRLVGKHQHYRRNALKLPGLPIPDAMVYEWDHCSDGLMGLKDAVLSPYSFKGDVSKAYKSAEIHTKPKFRLPMFVFIPLIVIPLAVWAIPKGYSTMANSMTGKSITAAPARPASASKAPGQAVTPVQSASAPTPFFPPGAPVPVGGASGPALPLGEKPAAEVKFAGCAAVRDRCSCFDSKGEQVDRPIAVCETRTGKHESRPLALAADRALAPGGASVAGDLDALAFLSKARR